MKEHISKISISITIKVLIFAAFLIGVPGVIIYFNSTTVSQDLLRKALEEKGVTLVRSIGKSCQLQILVGDYLSLQTLISSFKKEHNLLYVMIYDSEGNLLATTEEVEKTEFKDSLAARTNSLKILYPKLPNQQEVMEILFPITVEEFNAEGLLDMDLTQAADLDDPGTNEGSPLSDRPVEQSEFQRKIGLVRIQHSLDLLNRRIKEIKDQIFWSNILVFLFVFVAVMLSVNRIIKPFNEIIDLLQQITDKNDLTRRVSVPKQREMRILAAAFNSLIETLAFQINNTKSAALNIAQQIEPISHATMEQEAASRDQVSSVTQTMTSMAELSQSSRLIDQNSLKVTAHADQTLQNARQGVDAVNKVVTSISSIDECSRSMNNSLHELVDKIGQIQNIMGIIEGFIEQTKLIAFNAAIEASSAKTVGRRFSVVASEVRKLAGDIERSSRNINQVIQEIREMSTQTMDVSHDEQIEVNKGVEISALAKNAIARIFESVADTTKIAKQISVYTSQQISANDEVITAVKEILLLAENSMRNARKTTMATEILAELSVNLTETVEKFNI